MLKKKIKNNAKWQLSFKPVIKYGFAFCVLVLAVFLSEGVLRTLGSMESRANTSLEGSRARVSQRIGGALDLLKSLAGLPEFYDPEIPSIEKVRKLDQMCPYFGYLMICYVDSDINVYSDGSEPASLASRDYMQKLFATGQSQVTDSFAAGADGITLNYTAAVPLIDPQGNITGCLFCAVYFDEIEEMLKWSATNHGTALTIIGSQGQIMSSTEQFSYGAPIMVMLKGSVLFGGVTADKLQEQLLARQKGAYWSLYGGDLRYTTYQHIENTGWDILSSVSFRAEFLRILPGIMAAAGMTIFLAVGLMFMIRQYLKNQMKVVNGLVHSVAELEKKIYHDERPDNMDFNEIIKLTSNGLSDGLTGVVTRSVFLNQAPSYLKNADPDLVNALCFVDMDNLKYINDTHGHDGGDVALKSVGYILREYEKKYDGVVGRYGGDEFVLFLFGMDDETELRSVLNELVLRLHTEVVLDGRQTSIQCSIGVAIYHSGMTVEQLIHDADEALYFVKQNGKGYYKIYQN